MKFLNFSDFEPIHTTLTYCRLGKIPIPSRVISNFLGISHTTCNFSLNSTIFPSSISPRNLRVKCKLSKGTKNKEAPVDFNWTINSEISSLIETGIPINKRLFILRQNLQYPHTFLLLFLHSILLELSLHIWNL